MIIMLVNAIHWFANILVAIICISAIMTWIPMQNGGGLYKVHKVLSAISEPLITPFRRLLSRFTASMTIDFSPILAIVAIQIVDTLIRYILMSFL